MDYLKEWFYEWFSEDDILWWPKKYLFSKNIDVLNNSNFIQLTNKPTKEFYTSETVENIIWIQDRITNARTIVAFCSDWQVYTWQWWDTPVYDDSSLWNFEYPIFELWNYLYFITNNWPTSAFILNRISLSWAFSTTWSPTLTYKTLDNNNYFEYYWAITDWANAIIWLWNKINVFDSVTWAVTSFTLTQEEIAGITYTSWYFRVYTERWNMYLWDWISALVTEKIFLSLPIERVRQIWNNDYVITGEIWEQKGLYLVNWYKLDQLFKNKNSSVIWENKFNFVLWNNTSFTYYYDNLILINEWDSTYIDIYGNNIQGLNKWYSNLVANASTWKTLNWARSVFVYWDYLYYWYADADWQKWVDKVYLKTTSWKQATWEIVLNINDMQTYIVEKHLVEMQFRVADVTATQYIEVYQSIDWWAFKLIETINEQPLKNVAKINLVWEFRDITLKFKLYTNWTSPKIYNWIYIRYEENWI